MKILAKIKSIKLKISVFVPVCVYFYYNRSASESIKINKIDIINDTEINQLNNLTFTRYRWFMFMKRQFKDLGKEDRPRYIDKIPPCTLNISGLGPTLVNKTKLKLEWVEEKYPEIRGGFYAPTNCRARHKVAILVSYRDREPNLIRFLNHMHTFLKKQYLEYRIFVIEQYGSEKFNKGAMYNLGFLESQRFGNWDCFIFHDVDLLPLDERILYSCPRSPTHMSPAVESTGYRLPYVKLFGGVTALTPSQFEAVNGYSNLYWGWGGEDDDMFIRLQARRFPVVRYNQSIARFAVLRHTPNTPNQSRYSLLQKAKSRFREEGLSSIQYILVNATKRKLFTHIVAYVNPLNITRFD